MRKNCLNLMNERITEMIHRLRWRILPWNNTFAKHILQVFWLLKMTGISKILKHVHCFTIQIYFSFHFHSHHECVRETLLLKLHFRSANCYSIYWTHLKVVFLRKFSFATVAYRFSINARVHINSNLPLITNKSIANDKISSLLTTHQSI